MANEIEIIAGDLFNKVRSRFENVEIGDENASIINDPSKSRFVDFDFSDDGETYGHVTLSIVDPSTLKCYYSGSLLDEIDNLGHSKRVWYDFLKELRMFAKKRLMNFDPRDIAKTNLTQKDFKHISTVDVEDDETNMDTDMTNESRVNEASLGSMYGSKKRSYQALESTKVLVKHKKVVDEEKRGARSRQIESIFVENGVGERFKMPVNHLGGARAMARHVSNGGNTFDQIGESIIGMCETVLNIKEFNKYVRKNGLVNESTSNVITTVKEEYDALRNTISSLKGQRGYNSFAESFIPEALTEADAFDITEMKMQFTSKNYSDVIESILPKIARMCEAKTRMNEEEGLRDSGGATEEWLATEPTLILMPDENQDRYMITTKFNNNDSLMVMALEDIAQRGGKNIPDDVAVFAAQMSEEIGEGGPMGYGTPDQRRLSAENYKNNRKTAFKLAKIYMSDIIKLVKDPSYASVVRVGPSGEYKDRYGNVKTESMELEESLNRVFEGTWHWPTNDDEYREIAELLSGPLPVGIDAINATNALYDLLGDDELFDELGELAEREGEDADAAPLVMSWLEHQDRIVYAAVQGAIDALESEAGEEMGMEPDMGMEPPMDPGMEDPAMMDPNAMPVDPSLEDPMAVDPNAMPEDPNDPLAPQQQPVMQSGHSNKDPLSEMLRLSGQKKRI